MDIVIYIVRRAIVTNIAKFWFWQGMAAMMFVSYMFFIVWEWNTFITMFWATDIMVWLFWIPGTAALWCAASAFMLLVIIIDRLDGKPNNTLEIVLFLGWMPVFLPALIHLVWLLGAVACWILSYNAFLGDEIKRLRGQ